jgi:aminoglycoside phosphotransferase (APT) family kinase protein
MNQRPDPHARYSGTKDVAEKHRFDTRRLEAYMAEHVEGFRGPLQVRQFKGGQSNPTYQLTASSAKYVLRRKPPGKLLPSAHAVDREYRVMHALYGAGFPVPRPYVLCDDPEVVGTMFYIMDCVDGRVFWDITMPALTPAERGACFDSMNEVLARLHMLDFTALGLADFGKQGDYFARQIGRWSKQYRASETENIDEMNRLMEWLPAHIPADDSVCLAHGDYSLHNILFHPSEPRVLAVLDWELSTLGHPLGDLTYNMLAWYAPAMPGGMGSLIGMDLSGTGIPTQEEYIAAYCRRTGRAGVDNLDFYAAYNLFRIAGILQGIVGRVRDGTAANANAAEMEAQVRPLAQAAWGYARRAGAA